MQDEKDRVKSEHDLDGILVDSCQAYRVGCDVSYTDQSVGSTLESAWAQVKNDLRFSQDELSNGDGAGKSVHCENASFELPSENTR